MEFLNIVKEELEKVLGDGFIVNATTVEKINHELHAIIIMENNRTKNRVTAPVIYVDEYEKYYERGEADIEDVVNYIKRMFVNSQDNCKLLEEDSFSFDEVTLEVCNAELNKEFVEDIPHREFLDLIIYYVVRSKRGFTKIITNADIEGKLTENDLYETARARVAEEIDPNIKSLYSHVKEYSISEADIVLAFALSCVEEENRDVTSSMYIVTTKAMYRGAKAITDKSFQQQLYDKLGKYYVLPTSRDEVMVVPESITKFEDIEPYMKRIAYDNHLEMFLSDKVYFYDGEQLQIC